MPLFVILCGLPAYGKSTYISRHFADAVVVGLDRFLEVSPQYASLATYNERWAAHSARGARDYLAWVSATIADAAAKGKDIVVDATCLTPQIRKEWLGRCPASYSKRAICFKKPADWERRLGSRPGKNIPGEVLADMASRYVYATPEEGFEVVAVICS